MRSFYPLFLSVLRLTKGYAKRKEVDLRTNLGIEIGNSRTEGRALPDCGNPCSLTIDYEYDLDFVAD